MDGVLKGKTPIILNLAIDTSNHHSRLLFLHETPHINSYLEAEQVVKREN